jgi:hypothetical protein
MNERQEGTDESVEAAAEAKKALLKLYHAVMSQSYPLYPEAISKLNRELKRNEIVVRILLDFDADGIHRFEFHAVRDSGTEMFIDVMPTAGSGTVN